MLRSAAELLERSAARLPDKVGLVAQGRRLTWAQLDAMAARAAHALRERGVRRGDRVVLYGDNSVDLAVGVFAALYADAAFVVVSGMTRAEKLAYVLRDSGAAALVADAVLAPHWIGACALLGDAAPPVLVATGQLPRAAPCPRRRARPRRGRRPLRGPRRAHRRRPPARARRAPPSTSTSR